MAHPDFIFWMIGFPIGWAISSWINAGHSFPGESGGGKGIGAVIVIALWLGVGWALW